MNEDNENTDNLNLNNVNDTNNNENFSETNTQNENEQNNEYNPETNSNNNFNSKRTIENNKSNKLFYFLIISSLLLTTIPFLFLNRYTVIMFLTGITLFFVAKSEYPDRKIFVNLKLLKELKFAFKILIIAFTIYFMIAIPLYIRGCVWDCMDACDNCRNDCPD